MTHGVRYLCSQRLMHDVRLLSSQTSHAENLPEEPAGDCWAALPVSALLTLGAVLVI